jgi:hypothetical protein
MTRTVKRYPDTKEVVRGSEYSRRIQKPKRF